MSRSRRGSTGPGKPSALPAGDYQAPAAVRQDRTGLVVDFRGEDGRTKAFEFGSLPMPGWHAFAATAFALRVGPAGGLRTLTGARGCWDSLLRWIRWLEESAPEVTEPSQLTREHLDAFSKRDDRANSTRYQDMSELRLLSRPVQLHGDLAPDTVSALQRRLPRPDHDTGVGGYSDGEWARLVAAARADTAAVVRRIRAGEALVRRLREGDGELTQEERQLAVVLTEMAESGQVPGGRSGARGQLASHLFLTWKTVLPVMVLLAAVTERNTESIKELPAVHRILEDRAVEVVVTKRRRGAKRWFETVTWEIGPRARELHTPGGLYLLLLELTARSRGFSGSGSAICLWRNHGRRGQEPQGDHVAAFEVDLSDRGNMRMSDWLRFRTKPVLADPVREHGEREPAEARVLGVSFNRIKTSAEVRRTKAMGGHLPSAAKSNTAQVLYANYLRPDATVREWADEVMAQALVDAEQTASLAMQEALRVHDSRAAASGGGPTVLAAGPEAQLEGAVETAWAACTNSARHPRTGADCDDSFLACFHCGNCVVTSDNLPRLLALMDALLSRLSHMDEDTWWRRYGPAWVAIRRDILAKFTAEEVIRTRRGPLPDALLDIVEAPWEHL